MSLHDAAWLRKGLVLLTLTHTPEAADVFIAELDRSAGIDTRVDNTIQRARDALGQVPHYEIDARRLVEQLAISWTAALLVRHGDQDVADTYLRSRLDRDHGTAGWTVYNVAAHIGRVAVAWRRPPGRRQPGGVGGMGGASRSGVPVRDLGLATDRPVDYSSGVPGSSPSRVRPYIWALPSKSTIAWWQAVLTSR